MKENNIEIEEKDTIVLFSGGIDSLAATLQCLSHDEKVLLVYCDMNHKYHHREKRSAVTIAEKLKLPLIIDITTVNLGKWEEKDANIPMRNLYLILNAAQYALKFKAKKVVIQNVQVGETGPDRNLYFNECAQELVWIMNDNFIEIDAPFSSLTKDQIVKTIIDIGTKLYSEKFAIELIKDTTGCFANDYEAEWLQKHCGECAACFRRYISFEANGIDTTGMFDKDILKWSGTKEYIKKMKEGKYDERRANVTLTVLKRKGVAI